MTTPRRLVVLAATIVAALATLGSAALGQPGAAASGDAFRLDQLAGLVTMQQAAALQATRADQAVAAQQQIRDAIVTANAALLDQQDPLQSGPGALSQFLANAATGTAPSLPGPASQSVDAALGDYTLPQQRAEAAVSQATTALATAQVEAQHEHQALDTWQLLIAQTTSSLTPDHHREADWAVTLLNGLAAPISGPNLQALVAWQQAESTPPSCNNPLATTLTLPGSSDLNSVGVQCYQDPATGLLATLLTIRLPAYGAIVGALTDGTSVLAAAGAVAQSTWGTGKNAVIALGQL